MLPAMIPGPSHPARSTERGGSVSNAQKGVQNCSERCPAAGRCPAVLRKVSSCRKVPRVAQLAAAGAGFVLCRGRRFVPSPGSQCRHWEDVLESTESMESLRLEKFSQPIQSNHPQHCQGQHCPCSQVPHAQGFGNPQGWGDAPLPWAPPIPDPPFPISSVSTLSLP